MRVPAHVVEQQGRGVDVLCIHGTAADGTSWRDLVTLTRERVRTTTYDRRGTVKWPVDAGVDRRPSVLDHAEDAADLIADWRLAPVHLCAMSFGAVVALELMRQRPELIAGAVLFEPALSGRNGTSGVPPDLMATFEHYVEAGTPERAGEYFCRRTMGEQVWRSLPRVKKQCAGTMWQSIYLDLHANAAYRLDYDDLRAINVPVLLARGAQSSPVFEPALAALDQVLPASSRVVIPGDLIACVFLVLSTWPCFRQEVSVAIEVPNRRRRG